MANDAGDGDTGPEPLQPDEPTGTRDVLEAEERIKAKLVAEAAKKRRTTFLLLGIIAVALGTLGWEVWHYHLRRFRPAPDPPDLEIEIFEHVGSPEAKVKVEVLLEKCLESVQSLAYHVGRSYPDLVRAEFYPLHDEVAQQYAGEEGDSCAGVRVNGKDRFTVTNDTGTREVHLYMSPGGGYTEADLVAIIKQKMEEAYGAIPDDFDQKVSVEFGVGVPSVGAADAEVRVQVCLQKPSYPLIDLLSAIGKAFPSRFRVEFMGFTTQAAQEILSGADDYSPSIFVNGKRTFRLQTGGAKREVSFMGDPGPMYGLADVVAAIKAEFADTREGLPPTFDRAATIPEFEEPPDPTPPAE